ncbi:MAG: Lytic transglycosylase catalytic, partial [Bacteriovoracaceae bacterium]|nr:Lytic transglycosylase catalytic [Bacteriovoracaceae bacterium]
IRPALTFEAITVTTNTYFKEINQKYNFTLENFKKLNPGLRSPVLLNQRPIPRGTTVRLPLNSKRAPVLVASLEKHPISFPKQALESSKIPQIKVIAIKKLPLTELQPVKSELSVESVADGKGWIKMEINETINQVADWLNTPLEDLRSWNGLGADEQARLGQKLLIKFGKLSQAEFETRREDYHRKIREDFFARYEVAQLSDYEVKHGENLWSICYQKFEIPPWLLQEYNSKVSIANLTSGIKLKIPVLREKTDELVSAVQ